MSDNIKKVYQSFLKAGFSPNQAKALTAEVGRENAYQSKYIFGHHTDMANSADNLGFFSWQGERKKNLLKKLQQKGLYSNGRISESQESLDTMAEFAKEEMENISSYKKTKEGFLKNPNISQAEAAELLGRNYLRWDMDGKYIKNVDEHKKRRDKFYSQISGEPYIEQQYADNSQPSPQEQPQVGYVGMLPNGLPDVYGQPYVAEEKIKEEKTAEAPKRTDNANKLGFVADYEELSKQYEQQLQAQQKPILQQEIVEGVQYQPIQQEFKEGGYFFQKGGTWEKQQARMKAEKDAKLKKLLEQEKPVYKKKTFDEKLAEKRQEQETKVVVKDNTSTRNYNDATKHSNVARNKTDKEIAEERKAIREKSDANVLNSWSLDAFKPSNYTRENFAEMAQGLESKFRVSDEPNFFDDYLNPANMIGGMASNLGQAPLQAEQTNSYMPYVNAVGTPLAVGAMAGYGTQNTGQFVNNLANPLAGTEDLVDLYRIQQQGAKTFAQKAKEGTLPKFFNNPQTLARKAEEEKYFGRWFTTDKEDLDWYLKDREFSNPEYLHIQIPREQLSQYNIQNFDSSLSRAPEREFVLPEDLVKRANRYTNISEFKDGGIKVDPQGYWNPDNEGKPVIIPSPHIDMQNVSFPVLGTSLQTGEQKIMTTNNKYFFANTKNVLEEPLKNYEKK